MNTSTPVYALPSELTSLIFTFAKQSLDPTDAQLLPLKLAQVTRRWRDIAIGTGSLWTDIDISPRRTPDIISAYLTRSTPYPIDLTFTTPQKSHSRRTAASFDIDALFTLITPHLTRCRSIYVGSTLFQDTHSPELMRLIDLLSSHALPQLRQLSLDRTGSAKVPLALTAPRLTHLRLSGSRALAPELALDALTTLHLSIPLTYAQFARTLAAAPALATLAIYERNIEDWPAPTPGSTLTATTLPVPALRSLQLYGHRMCKVSELLLALSAPGLTELVIAPIVPSDLTLLRRAPNGPEKFPMLQSLTIAPAHFDALGVLPTAAECFPSVKHLAFANVYAEGFAEMFVPPISSNESMLWPSLESIALRNVGDKMARLVGGMVRRRKASGSALKEVRLDPQTCTHFPGLMREIGDEGVNVGRVDTWRAYREAALFRDVEDQFLGREDEDDE